MVLLTGTCSERAGAIMRAGGVHAASARAYSRSSVRACVRACMLTVWGGRHGGSHGEQDTRV